jgi:hypothetical protein
MVILELSKQQFNDFLKGCEDEQALDPNKYIQIFVCSDSQAEPLNGFGFTFNPFIVTGKETDIAVSYSVVKTAKA